MIFFVLNGPAHPKWNANSREKKKNRKTFILSVEICNRATSYLIVPFFQFYSTEGHTKVDKLYVGSCLEFLLGINSFLHWWGNCSAVFFYSQKYANLLFQKIQLNILFRWLQRKTVYIKIKRFFFCIIKYWVVCFFKINDLQAKF